MGDETPMDPETPMHAETTGPLTGQLVALGRSLVVDPPPADLADRVLTRIATEQSQHNRRWSPWARPWPLRLRRWLGRSRRRVVAVAVAALVVALALTPPVRAAIGEWLRIGGVIFRSAPVPRESPAPAPPRTTGRVGTVEEARRLVDFDVRVPEALGQPAVVTVSGDRRVVGMDWGGGADRVHLDQFDGRLSWVFVKESWSDLEPVRVGAAEGVWFAEPHRVVYVDAAGVEHSAEARLAGPTLLWELADTAGLATTLRLEGRLGREQAVTIAASVR